MKADTEYIVFGHSHARYAINDNYIPKLQNVAINAEPYFYTYQKVKHLVSHNKQVKTILVEFTNNQITKDMDNWIWGDIYLQRAYPFHAPLLNNEDQNILITHNFDGYLNALSLSVKENLYIICKNEIKGNFGGYVSLGDSHADSIINKIKNNRNKFTLLPREISEINLKYLQKIEEFCDENDIALFLIRSPQHPLSLERNNEKQFQKIRKKYFNDIVFLDFNNFPLENEDFNDLEHVNSSGATKFSKWLRDIFEENRLLDKNILWENDTISN